MGFLPYIIAGIIFIGAAAGFYGKIHHDGYEQGVNEVKTQWDQANAAQQKKIDEQRAKEAALRDAQDKQATRRLADEKKRNATLMASLEAHIHASGALAKCPMPDSLRDDWNLGNSGPTGKDQTPGTVPSGSRKSASTH